LCVYLPLWLLFSFYCAVPHPHLPSFPTRRSSDLIMISPLPGVTAAKPGAAMAPLPGISAQIVDDDGDRIPNSPEGGEPITGYLVDRKSTRLNSSHVKISYAVFCLKKKKKKETTIS